MNKQRQKTAFTLMELMVVLIIISIFSAFGAANYQKAVLKARERKGILSLKTIHGANEVFKTRSAGSVYLPGTNLGLAAINTGLSIRIFDNDLTYNYTRATNTTYTATAAWAGVDSFTIRINQAPVTTANPCCSAGSCKVLAACP